MEQKQMIKSEIENYAKFDIIRYAQVWEDAEILIEALDINENDNILSIASAGENCLAMLIKNPQKIYAIDLNKTQIACTEFKIASYKYLEYEECMQLLGVFECNNRLKLYDEIKDKLTIETKDYFDNSLDMIRKGLIHSGKFENYFKIFRTKILPVVHKKKTRDMIFEKKTKEERYKFYSKKWNNFRWEFLFRIFFSRTVMGKFGRDKAFFKYVDVNVAEHILERTKYAFTELDPSDNSYMYYVFNGKYKDSLPMAYRKENFEMIKKNIDKIELLTESVESFIERKDVDYISKYNLSDIFEYMSDEQMCKIIEKILTKSPTGSKLAYWNMLSEKQASKYYDKLEYQEELSNELWKRDKAFFYSKFIVEEIQF